VSEENTAMQLAITLKGDYLPTVYRITCPCGKEAFLWCPSACNIELFDSYADVVQATPDAAFKEVQVYRQDCPPKRRAMACYDACDGYPIRLGRDSLKSTQTPSSIGESHGK